MSLSYEKLVRGLSLLLLSSSIISSFIKPNGYSVAAGALALGLYISFEIIEFFKSNKEKENKELEILKNRMTELEKSLDDIKGDHSLAHLAATFKRK